MLDDTPRCEECSRPLDRIDHYGIRHTILDNGEYRDVNMGDRGIHGEEYPLASEIDLRCGYCGEPIDHEARKYFYRRWDRVREATAAMVKGRL